MLPMLRMSMAISMESKNKWLGFPKKPSSLQQAAEVQCFC